MTFEESSTSPKKKREFDHMWLRVCSDSSQNKPYQISTMPKSWQFGNIAKFWQEFLYIYQSLDAQIR